MVRELLLAIGIPALMLGLAVQMVAPGGHRFPSWLRPRRRYVILLRVIRLGLIVGLGLFRVLMQR